MAQTTASRSASSRLATLLIALSVWGSWYSAPAWAGKMDKLEHKYVKWRERKFNTGAKIVNCTGGGTKNIGSCNATNACGPGGCPYNRRTVFHNGYVHWRSCLMPVTIPLKDQAYCGGGSRADSCKNLGHNNVHPHPIGATTAACKVSPSCTVPWHPSLPGRQCNYWMEGTGMLSACGGDPTTFWVTNCFYTHHCKTSSGSGCLVKYSACECSTDRCRGQGDGNPSATVGCSAAACLAGYNPDCATGYYNCSGAGLTDGYCFCRYPGTGFYNPP